MIPCQLVFKSQSNTFQLDTSQHYLDPVEAENALQGVNGLEYKGKCLKVEKSTSQKRIHGGHQSNKVSGTE